PTFPTVPPACPPDYVRCQDGACRKTNCEDCRDLSLESRLAIAIPLAILVFVILVVFIVKFRPSKSVTVRTSQPDSSSK
ncbi:basement membrane-specific heparan sulfate proteoglycan core protein, partial [Biomphalaria glabrata]